MSKDRLSKLLKDYKIPIEDIVNPMRMKWSKDNINHVKQKSEIPEYIKELIPEYSTLHSGSISSKILTSIPTAANSMGQSKISETLKSISFNISLFCNLKRIISETLADTSRIRKYIAAADFM